MSDQKPIASDADKHPAAKGAVAGGVVGGVAGGAAAGAAVGGMTGPVGAAVGAVVGAAVGALAGRKADPKIEDAYWRDNYSTRPYVNSGSSYDDYGPAYRYGVDTYGTYVGRPFDEVEPTLARDWERSRGHSRLAWEKAKYATKDSWERLSDTVERAIPGDSDRDGK